MKLNLQSVLALSVTVTGFLLLMSCAPSNKDQERKISSSISSRPPPPPPPPHDDQAEEVAIGEAKAAGFGSCEDIRKIKIVPLKGEIGFDRNYDRIMVNFSEYQPCLIRMIMDETPIEDKRSAPTRYPFFLGDLAYDLIIDSGKLEYQTCMPDEVKKAYKKSGYFAFHSWLHSNGNRAKLRDCVVENIRL